MLIEQKNQSSADFTSKIPLAGTFSGVLAGVAARVFRGIGFDSKSPGLYQLNTHHILKILNGTKQWEIKNYSLFFPFLPLIGTVTYCAAKDWKKEEGLTGLSHHLITHLKRIPAKTIIFTVSIVALSFFTNGLIALNARALFQGFDPSSHMILKITLSHCFKASSEAADQLDQGTIKKTMHVFTAVIIAFTDAILIYYTTLYFHTVAEIATGIGIGLLIHSIGTSIAH